MYNKLSILITGIIIILSGFCNAAPAQALPGKKDSVGSAILNQKRFVQVVLPANYKPGAADKYDVIYVLDGDGNTGLVNTIAQFINSEGFMPPVIVVGVLNIDRNKDLTPTRGEGFNTSGGGADFLAFLKTELRPYIDKNYPTSGHNTLWGHSFGGLLVTYALLNEPGAFTSYIAADPSYWWDNRYLIRIAANKLPLLAGTNHSIFITGREGQGLQEMAILPMDTLFKKYSPEGLSWKLSAYADETHGSVRLKSIYDGLRFVYDGYGQKAPEFHPMAGILLKDKPIKIWCMDDTAKIHYTIDGTMPTAASPNMQHALTMPGPGTFTAKFFTGHDMYDKSAKGTFTDKGAPEPVAKETSFKPGGFHYAYYEGTWDKLPDFAALKPVKEGTVTKDFDVSKLPLQANFGVVISGQLEIKEEGYYIFALASDDGSKFYLGNKLLIDNDGLHDGNDYKSYIVPLKKGFYPVRLEYFQKDGGSSLRLVYIPPAMVSTDHPTPASIPQEQQYGGE